MTINSEFYSLIIPPWLLLASGVSLAFIITWLGIPSVVRIARIKSMFDLPGDRTSHETPTPRLGGAMIFAGVIMSSVLFTSLGNAYELKYIIAGMIVLFFIGVKDDLVSLMPIKKATGQFIASSIIVFAGDIRITGCFGFMNVTDLPYFASVILTIAIVMFLINSINFIDGIDGLASGVGIIASSVLGTWYIVNGHVSYAVMCYSLTGSLTAFFYYNVFSRRYKIFLGDTGSMIIGFLLAVFVIHFLGLNADEESVAVLHQAPSVALAILFVPVFDTTRILIIRMLTGKSIFKADNNHIHHRVLELSGSHLKATATILIANLLLIVMTYLLRHLSNPILIFSLLIMGLIFTLVLGISLKNMGKE
jgi:UDP-GlcNAc:undecaprenyl-phosphate/decaprenyl-phosphate GlcNAc-1-phosphate transferase